MLFGTGAASQEDTALERRPPASADHSGRREPPTQLDWSQAEYIPLPPSPSTWEVDGREKADREYRDPVLAPIFRAAFNNQHTKVVTLAADLSTERLQGRAGALVAQAYRKIVVQRMKSGQHAAAAKRCLEMFERVPNYVDDVDKRRFNRILKQMEKAGKKHDYEPVNAPSPPSTPLFTVSHGSGWVLDGERKLIGDERSDTAFKIAAFGSAGSWLFARSKGSDGEPSASGVLRRLDRLGHLAAERALSHDAYRTGTGANGSSFAIMDSSGQLHIYDATLELAQAIELREDRRVREHFRTIETNYWGEFRSQVRAVDVAPDGERYLFTFADEAWCCRPGGAAVWGVAMPLAEGWERVARRGDRFGVSREIYEALDLLGLVRPVSPSEIKARYWTLAQTHHPDRNPDSPQAAVKMRALNLAFELLTGLDPATVEFEDSEAETTYFARAAPDSVFEVEGFRIEVTFGGSPQDWVYAASFAADGGAFVATYSGKVILLSDEGNARIVYDIGTFPNEIIDMGRYTYFLTPTRLYVMEGSRQARGAARRLRSGASHRDPSRLWATHKQDLAMVHARRHEDRRADGARSNPGSVRNGGRRHRTDAAA